MRRAVPLLALALAACTQAPPQPVLPPPQPPAAADATWRTPGETADERRLREKLFVAFHAGACGAMPSSEAISLGARISALANVDDGMPMPRVRALASAAMARAYEDPDYRDCSVIAVAQARDLARQYPPFRPPAARPPAITRTRPTPAPDAPRPAQPPAPRGPRPGEIDI
jgi:hypothetical protein